MSVNHDRGSSLLYDDDGKRAESLIVSSVQVLGILLWKSRLALSMMNHLEQVTLNKVSRLCLDEFLA